MAHSPGSQNATILSNLKDYLRGRSLPAFVVGGYIRDSLRGLHTRDVDLAVHGDAISLSREMADALGGAFMPLSHAHQNARVALPSPDGPWLIDVSSIQGDILTDLGRRDFTVDAMALPIADWDTPGWEDRILDPFDGRRDIARRIIQALGPSVFRDDPARLLRAVRLAAKLGFQIDVDTRDSISRHAHLLPEAAGERVRDELLTILSLDEAKTHLETLDELGLLYCIIPELGTTKGVQQPKEHYWDVFGHSINAVEGVERLTSRREGDPIADLAPWSEEMEERFSQEVSDGHTRRTVLKVAALLHDIAKPQTRMMDDTGRTRFFGHHSLGASMSGPILQRLRMSNRGVEMVSGMVEYHLRPGQISQGDELPTSRAVYRYFRDVGEVATDTLYLSLGDHLAARGPDLDMAGWQRHVDTVAHVLEVGAGVQAQERSPRLIAGHDVIKEFHLAPGPLIGELLESVAEAQATGEVDSPDGALAWVRNKLEVPDTEELATGREGS